MPEINLVRRWGSHDAGESVTVDETMATWLVGTNHGERPDAPGTASAGSRAPGTDGADPRAGGDVSRGGGMQIQRANNRHDGENYANRAAPVAGAPRSGGPNVLPDVDKEKAAKPEQKSSAKK